MLVGFSKICMFGFTHISTYKQLVHKFHCHSVWSLCVIRISSLSQLLFFFSFYYERSRFCVCLILSEKSLRSACDRCYFRLTIAKELLAVIQSKKQIDYPFFCRLLSGCAVYAREPAFAVCEREKKQKEATRKKNMFSQLYLLLTFLIVTKFIYCYVVDNSASMRNEVNSQTDDRKTAYFDNINENINDVGNHIRTSAINVTAIDNDMEMPKPNDTVDSSTFQSNRDLDGALAEVETGEPS